MRHDWTLLCTEAQARDTGAIDLRNVFSTLQVTAPFGMVEEVGTVLFDPPTVLASQWTAEFESDRRIHFAKVQLLAPGGEQVLWAEVVELDFRQQSLRLMMLILPALQFVGEGTYEYHVLIEEFAILGEWGRASLTISEYRRG